MVNGFFTIETRAAEMRHFPQMRQLACTKNPAFPAR
jgi:hypothetical protein